MKTILAVLLASFMAAAANAATFDCTVSCDIISDAFPPLPSPQPAQCKLFDGAALVATTAVEAVTGGVRCKFTRTIAANVTVTYTAKGVFAGVDGDPSAPPLVFTSMPPGDVSPPTAPPSLAATVSGSSQINLAWGAASDNVGVVRYRVERCQGAACSTFAEIATPAGLAYSDTGLAAATPYSYRVRAEDAAGNRGPYSVTASATTAAASTFTFGETAILAGAGSGNANLLLAQNATLPQPGTTVSMSFYVVQPSGNIRLAIYDATGPGGGPGALKAQTGSIVSVLGWNTANVVTAVTLPAGTYWLAHVLSSNTLSEAFATTAGIASKYQALTFGSLPATFSTTPTAYPPHFSIYATMNSAAPPPLGPAPTNLRIGP